MKDMNRSWGEEAYRAWLAGRPSPLDAFDLLRPGELGLDAAPGPDLLRAAEAYLGPLDLYLLDTSAEPARRTKDRLAWEAAYPDAEEFERVRAKCDLRRRAVAQAVEAYADPEVLAREGRGREKAAYASAAARVAWGYCVRALYAADFSLPVRYKGEDHPTRFVPGHVWGPRMGQGPLPERGPAPAEILVVGKFPGLEEERYGYSFVGPSGQLLRDALVEAGFSRAEVEAVYVTNLVRFRHPDPNADNLPASFIKDCRLLLDMELRLVRPRYVLLLGAEAVKAFRGPQATLSGVAGEAFPLEVPTRDGPHTARILACVHPARVLHEPEQRPLLLEGLRQLRRLSRGEEARPAAAGGEVLVVRGPAELEGLVRRAGGARAVAVDCEWQGRHPGHPFRLRPGEPAQDPYLRTVQLAWGPDRAAVLVLRDEAGRVALDPDAARDALRRVLRPGVRLVGHYLAADVPWLADWGLGEALDLYRAPEDDPDPDAPGWRPGYAKTRTEGMFDTMLAAHAVEETQDLGLKYLARVLAGVPAWDGPLNAFLQRYCAAEKLDKGDLPGFGMVPDEVLLPYAATDVLATYRLFEALNGGGRPSLDEDRYGNYCREPFWISLRAAPAFLEMHMNGLHVDMRTAEQVRRQFAAAYEGRLRELRARVAWPDFNPESAFQLRALLFGDHLTGRIDKNGRRVPVLPRPYSEVCHPADRRRLLTARRTVLRRQGKWTAEDEAAYQAVPPRWTREDPPPAAEGWEERQAGNQLYWERWVAVEPVRSLGLEPYITTGKRPKLWEEVAARGEAHRHAPSCNRETLTVLAPKDPTGVVGMLREVKLLRQVTKAVLRPPDELPESPGGDDEEGQYSEGFLSFVGPDHRVHTHFSQTKETGRASSWSPPLQNLSKRREEDYARIFKAMGVPYEIPMRGIIVAPPGYVIVECDYKGAELDGMAGQAQDPSMMDHARRMKLPEEDPDHYDIHSAVAIQAFRLTDPATGRPPKPSKPELKRLGLGKKRDAAKPVVFGYAYGMAAGAAQRRAKEEGVDLSLEEAEGLIKALESLYPRLPAYFAECRRLVRSQGWIANAFGRFRRFYPTADRKAAGDQEREGQNFPIQSMIADAISRAMDFLYYHPARREVGYRLILQIHDALMFLVPEGKVRAAQKVIRECMVERVPLWPTDLGGRTIPGAKPYRLDIDFSVHRRWGVSLSAAEKAALLAE